MITYFTNVDVRNSSLVKLSFVFYGNFNVRIHSLQNSYERNDPYVEIKTVCRVFSFFSLSLFFTFSPKVSPTLQSQNAK